MKSTPEQMLIIFCPSHLLWSTSLFPHEKYKSSLVKFDLKFLEGRGGARHRKWTKDLVHAMHMPLRWATPQPQDGILKDNQDLGVVGEGDRISEGTREEEQEPRAVTLGRKGEKQTEKKQLVGKEQGQSREYCPRLLLSSRLNQRQAQGCWLKPQPQPLVPPRAHLLYHWKHRCAVLMGCSAGQAKLLCNGRHFFISSKSKPDTAWAGSQQSGTTLGS